MKHIRTIINKEWAEVFKNRVVIMSMLLMPLLFTALPLVMLGTIGNTGMEGISPESSGLPANFIRTACQAGVTAGDCMQMYLVNEFLILFMLLPIMIPITISAYSIVGEKTTRSLEPLLATPISTVELLAGKCLAAAIPAMLATYLSYGIFNLGLLFLKIAPAVRAYIGGPTWILGIVVLGPILSVIAVIFSLFVSARVSDPRVAEQLSAVIILPVMLLLFAQLAGVIVVSVLFMSITIVVCLAIAYGMLHLGTLIFDRENILTRWK